MQLKELTTERRNRATENLDLMTSIELVTAMNREDAVVPRAIHRVLPDIAKAVDVIAHCLSKGGRLIYVGSGTSGRIGALEYAGSKGAATTAVSCNHGSALGKAAKIRIEVEVGPEVLAGSSRLKAGTAQKLICNMLTTGAMAQLGYVYSNLMVNLHLTNKKLLERGITMLEFLAQVDRDLAVKVLEKAGMSPSLALVMLKANASKGEAMRRLRSAKGNVRKAIEG